MLKEIYSLKCIRQRRKKLKIDKVAIDLKKLGKECQNKFNKSRK